MLLIVCRLYMFLKCVQGIQQPENTKHWSVIQIEHQAAATKVETALSFNSKLSIKNTRKSRSR